MAALLLALVPDRVLAAGNAAGTGETATVVALLLGVALAYLFAHLVVDRLQRRFLILSGAEYLLLGLLLGPTVPEIAVLDDLTGLLPIIALAAGWVGLLRGMEFPVESWRQWAPGTARITVVHQVVSGTLVGYGVYAFLWHSPWAGYFFEEYGPDSLAWREVAASSFFLGCCAAGASAEPFDLLKKRYGVDGGLTDRLRTSARVGDVFVILVFALLFCVWHPDSPGAQLRLSATEWGVIQLGLGLLLGALFTPFLGGHETPNGRFLAMVGIITFAAGAAFFLDLSPLAVNLVLGIVVVNVARTGKLMYETLASSEKPINIVLMVLAGALWRPPPLAPTLVVLVGFVLVRWAGKVLGSRLAAWGMSAIRRDLWRGFLSQGEVTIAMAVSFQIVFDGPVVDLAYTVALASTVLHDLWAPRVLRNLLVDVGDIRREQTVSTPQTQETRT